MFLWGGRWEEGIVENKEVVKSWELEVSRRGECEVVRSSWRGMVNRLFFGWLIFRILGWKREDVDVLDGFF